MKMELMDGGCIALWRMPRQQDVAVIRLDGTCAVEASAVYGRASAEQLETFARLCFAAAYELRTHPETMPTTADAPLQVEVRLGDIQAIEVVQSQIGLAFLGLCAFLLLLVAYFLWRTFFS